MANPEHLKILKQGVEVWNQWREEKPSIQPDLANAYAVYWNLNGASLQSVDLNGADLQGANLDGANLSNTNLSDTKLNGGILDGAILCNADLTRASMIEVSLRGADLSNSSLIAANINKSDLNGADLTAAIAAHTTFATVDLSSVKGLDVVRHNGPSIIGVDTIHISRGKIPEVFLRGCGIPEEFIVYVRSLIKHPIQFYTCFISFTEADDAFSERLYNDLQMKGVRCWRWKEDAKWGETLMRSINEAVRIYDKLIIICSEQSLNSPAVIREIERALQKEDELARQGKEAEVLFPIRLDDYIFTGWNHHRKADVTAKNVGDSRHWKNHDSYQKAFDRLLRDLKASE